MIADFGYDAATHYRGRTVEDLTEALREACPDGVDVYFDNTSGDISSAVIDVFNMYARHIVIGRMAISHLADTSKDIGRRDNNALLVKRIRKQGFVVFDEASNFPAATKQLAAWVADGSLIVKEDILDGIERAPEAFFRMMDGKSDGKQLVRIARTES